jgi:transporter family protein
MTDWLMWALLSACFAALTALFAKVGVGQVDPDLATFLRAIVILAVLGLMLATRGELRALPTVSTRALVFLALSGLATGASWVCYFRALAVGDAARVAPIDKLSVVMVAVFASLFLGERLSQTNWLGIGLIAFGAWLVTLRA